MAEFLCICGCGARVLVRQISADGLVYGVVKGSKEYERLMARERAKEGAGMETRELGRDER